MTETKTAAPDGGATSTTADAGGQADLGGDATYWKAEAEKAFKIRDGLKDQLREHGAADSVAQQEAARKAAESGQWKEAHDKLVAWQQENAHKMAEYDAMRTRTERSLDAAVLSLPEKLRGVVPEHLSVVERLDMYEALAQTVNEKTPPTSPPVPTTTPPTNGDSGPPPRGTPEFAAWQKTAPIEKVREARSNWFTQGRGR